MKRLYAFFICLLAVLAMQAQIVTTTPDFPTENDEVTIIFDATKGTAGLKGFTGDVYAHTGVILSTGTSWQYAPTWGDNSAKYKLTSLGNDKWQLKITPNIREYYDDNCRLLFADPWGVWRGVSFLAAGRSLALSRYGRNSGLLA